MHIKNFFPKALLACASLALATAALPAATLTYTQGDLLLAVRASGGVGGTVEMLVNIGPASQYMTPGSFQVTNIGLDMNANFTGWQTRSDVVWGVFGNVNPNLAGQALFATRADGMAPWNTYSGSAAGTPISEMNSIGNAIIGDTSTVNNDFALIQSQDGVTSFSTAIVGQDFGFFSGDTTTSFASGTAGATLDLYRVGRASSLANVGPAPLLGSFTINDSGVVTYTAVPEPTSAVLLTLGAGALMVRRRRRRA